MRVATGFVSESIWGNSRRCHRFTYIKVLVVTLCQFHSFSATQCYRLINVGNHEIVKIHHSGEGEDCPICDDQWRTHEIDDSATPGVLPQCRRMAPSLNRSAHPACSVFDEANPRRTEFSIAKALFLLIILSHLIVANVALLVSSLSSIDAL